MTRHNPYSLDRLWSDETHAAFKTMPQYGGYVVALDYVKPKDVTAFENLWREWCKQTPRNLWPTWLDGWKERKEARGRK